MVARRAAAREEPALGGRADPSASRAVTGAAFMRLSPVAGERARAWASGAWWGIGRVVGERG
jgi:hypothetical protein